jgi:tripartite ATP-independent transporter DctM subunit
LYAFILSVLIYREVPLREVPRILVDSASTTAIVMLLIGTSMALSWVLAYERIPEALSAGLLSMTGSKVAILLLINGILLAVGTVLDMTPAVLIFTPIMLPVVEALGLHPVHFGVVMVLNLCIGLCTPPVGSVLFLGCSVSGTRITEISRALVPLYVAMIVALLTVTFVPEIALFLPRWFGLLD